MPDITAITLERDRHHRFVIASDGMWDVLTVETVQSIVLRIPDAKDAALELVKTAWSQRLYLSMRMDDITAIVVDVNGHNFVAAKKVTVDVGCNCVVS